MRKKSGGQQGGRRGGNNKQFRSKSSKPKESSGPITLGDLSGLLSGLSSDSSSKKEKKVSSKKAGMKRLGNLGAHRGSRSHFKKKE
jgi:hypothetical protein